MAIELTDCSFLVTGGAGFLGSFIVQKLQERGVERILVPRSRDFDLTQEQQVQALFEMAGQIDIVIHAAGVTGGIGFNRRYPGTALYKNIMMNTLVMEYAMRQGIAKFVGIGSVCSYPKFAPLPFKEHTIWDGYPEETNAPYGLAKKMMLVQGQSYKQEFGFNAVHCLMINLYGPRDNFHPEDSHVIPALVAKLVDARRDKGTEVVVWGTGEATREFLYVEDAAEGVVLATEYYDKPAPVNLGVGDEISIRDLVAMIKDLVGFNGEVRWDASKPAGQPRRCLDVSKAKLEFGFEAHTPLKEGLQRTIAYYEGSHSNG